MWTLAQPAGSESVSEARWHPCARDHSPQRGDGANPADIDELQIALELGAALARAGEEDCVWRVLANALRQLPGVDTAAVFVVDGVQHRLVAARTSGSHADCSRDCRWQSANA